MESRPWNTEETSICFHVAADLPAGVQEAGWGKIDKHAWNFVSTWEISDL